MEYSPDTRITLLLLLWHSGKRNHVSSEEILLVMGSPNECTCFTHEPKYYYAPRDSEDACARRKSGKVRYGRGQTMTTYTKKQIVEIFNSGAPARPPQLDTTYGSIFDWLADGQITMRELTLTCDLDPRVRLFQDYTRGGRKHGCLAWWTASFLLSLGKNPLPEMRRNGCYIDVIADDDSWWIECGDTDGHVVLGHLRTCSHFAVLPFGTGEPPTLFVFERGPNWQDKLHSANAGWDWGDTQVTD